MTNSIIVYDCEIESAIPKRSEPLIPNIKYCKGWSDWQGMGISCITVYDYLMDQYRIFCKDNFGAFQALIDETELVVGFNNNKFDDNLTAVNHIIIDPDKTYDILRELWAASDLPWPATQKDFDFKKHTGFSLDATCEVNLKLRKSGEGAAAPIAWQQGRIGEVLDYGLRDTWLTKKVFDKILDAGTLISPKSGKVLQMRDPFASL